MADSQHLKPHLQRWATAYGGDQYARLGYANQDRLAASMAVTGDDVADRVETIIQRMERQGRWKEARVLRAELLMEALPESERLGRLKRVGLSIGRSAYYAYLQSAYAFVDGALGEETGAAS